MYEMQENLTANQIDVLPISMESIGRYRQQFWQQ